MQRSVTYCNENNGQQKIINNVVLSSSLISSLHCITTIVEKKGLLLHIVKLDSDYNMRITMRTMIMMINNKMLRNYNTKTKQKNLPTIKFFNRA